VLSTVNASVAIAIRRTRSAVTQTAQGFASPAWLPRQGALMESVGMSWMGRIRKMNAILTTAAAAVVGPRVLITPSVNQLSIVRGVCEYQNRATGVLVPKPLSV
jgi:hypothetical protein